MNYPTIEIRNCNTNKYLQYSNTTNVGSWYMRLVGKPKTSCEIFLNQDTRDFRMYKMLKKCSHLSCISFHSANPDSDFLLFAETGSSCLRSHLASGVIPGLWPMEITLNQDTRNFRMYKMLKKHSLFAGANVSEASFVPLYLPPNKSGLASSEGYLNWSDNI